MFKYFKNSIQIAKKRFMSSSHSNYYDKYAKETNSSLLKNTPSLQVKLSLRLDDVVKKEKLEGLSTTTIVDIWKNHFDKKPLTTSLSVSEGPFSIWWHHRARESPLFVVPLVVGKGFCNFMTQCIPKPNGGILVYTTLDDFQRFKESAPARLISYAFDDLLKAKKIGLIKSEFDGSLLTRQQADTLLRTFIDFYSSDEAYKWVHTFNHDPNSFNFESYLQYFEAKYKSQ